MNEPLIQVENLTRDYAETRAVDGISFEVARGQVLGFLGPNGAGKTTTMQMLSGNLAPSRGRIRIAGIDLLDRPRQAKAALGYLAERPPLYRELTVDEYLGYCARLNRIPRSEARQALARARRRCGLEEVGNRLIGNLSKGYQQRVGIAQAIIHSPPVVILDEPTVGLDPIQIGDLRNLIRELGAEHAVILSTHILPEVQAICSDVLIINRGRLVLSQSVQELERGQEGSDLRLCLSRPPTDVAAAVGALPGVAGVQHLGDDCLLVRCDPGEGAVAERIAQAALTNRWGLREIAVERHTLERVFLDLVHRDPGQAPPARPKAAG